ncbi:MAG: heparin lyase I family protein [Oleispira antarctica]|nr:heparin lyase I family protein [Oleispira antarctica]MBQ0794223.1 heparin lyase I family protein [Oleispira antarctica]
MKVYRQFIAASYLILSAHWSSAEVTHPVNFNLSQAASFLSHDVDLVNLLQSPPDFSYDFELGINATHLRGAPVPYEPAAPAWRFAQIQNPNGVQVLQDPTTGNHYVKTFWEKGTGLDYDDNTQRKIQIYGEFGAHARQEEVWYFESFFPTEGFAYDNFPEIIVQLHGRPDACEYDRDPPLAIEVKQDDIIITWRHDERVCTPAGFSDWNERVRNLGPLPKDQLVSWIIHAAWDPNGNGALTIIVNNKVLFMEDNLFIGFEDDVSPYIGWGIYKFPLNSNHQSRTAYYDNFKQWIIK